MPHPTPLTRYDGAGTAAARFLQGDVERRSDALSVVEGSDGKTLQDLAGLAMAASGGRRAARLSQPVTLLRWRNVALCAQISCLLARSVVTRYDL